MPSLATFHQFGKLPKKLQIQIWRYSKSGDTASPDRPSQLAEQLLTDIFYWNAEDLHRSFTLATAKALLLFQVRLIPGESEDVQVARRERAGPARASLRAVCSLSRRVVFEAWKEEARRMNAGWSLWKVVVQLLEKLMR